jgi:hypothetical protein
MQHEYSLVFKRHTVLHGADAPKLRSCQKPPGLGWKVWRPDSQAGGDTRYFCGKQLSSLLVDKLCSSAAVSYWFSDVSEKRRASRIVHSDVNGMSSHRQIRMVKFRMQNNGVRRSVCATQD